MVFSPCTEKVPPIPAALFAVYSLILVLALLIGNAAAGFAGRLARGLALAAAAVLGALAQVAGLNGLNMLHGRLLLMFILFLHFIMYGEKSQLIFSVPASFFPGRSDRP